jgi:hypothetical protein
MSSDEEAEKRRAAIEAATRKLEQLFGKLDLSEEEEAYALALGKELMRIALATYRSDVQTLSHLRRKAVASAFAYCLASMDEFLRITP